MLRAQQWIRLVALAFAASTAVFVLLYSAGTSQSLLPFRLPFNNEIGPLAQNLTTNPLTNDNLKTSPETTSDDLHSGGNDSSEGKPTGESPEPLASIPVSETSPVVLEKPVANHRKAVVMGKLSSENTDWVGELSGWESAVYVVDLPADMSSPTGLKTKMNKAKEAFPYLTYIIEHYSSFPDIAVFVHSHRGGWPQAWHNDVPGYDAVRMLQILQLPTVEKRGYVNLRCTHEPGCPREIELNPPGSPQEVKTVWPEVYAEFFNTTVDAVREQIPVVATQCCAQFAVAKTEVMKRPKSEYERLLAIVERSSLDDETLGRVMEYFWHVLFGQEAVHCEAVQTCRKEIFGAGH